MTKRNKLIILSVALVVIVVALIGTSYAFFTSNVTGDTSETVITSGTMRLEFSDGPEITLNDAIPGDSVVKTFSVENTGTLTTTYDIYFSELCNLFIDKTDLAYTIRHTSANGYELLTETEVPSTSSKIIDSQSIAPNETQTYEITIKFLNKDENQDDNQGAYFATKFNLNEYKNSSSCLLRVDNPITIMPSSAEWEQSKTYIISGSTKGARLQYQTGSSINENNWQDYSEAIPLTSNANVYARLYDGINASEVSTYKEEKIDTATPSITIGSVTSTPNTITIPFTTTYTGGSGIKSTTCKITSPTVVEGTISNNTCTISGLSESTTYSYEVYTETNVGKTDKKTGSQATTCNDGIASVNGTKDFSYIGSVQTFNTCAGRTYKLEVWGAQGGSSNGGKGAYASSKIGFDVPTLVYIYVGGQGNIASNSSSVAGGYNGGGATGTGGSYWSSYGTGCGSGGGASDIRIGGTAVSNRKIVAGGGGGGWQNPTWNTSGLYAYNSGSLPVNSPSYWYQGGYAGGAGQAGSGGSGCAVGGRGATQSGSPQETNHCPNGTYANPGTLGQGSAGASNTNYSAGPGGGGGYYGGQGGGSGCGGASGGGGSSYATGSDVILFAGNQTFKSPSGSNETGHSGNGYARITRLS